MGFIQKMLGKRDPLEQMRLFYSRKNWAGAFTAARKIETGSLTQEERREVVAIEQHAGDQLALLNLDEGQGEIRNGNLLRARDHFQLAAEQVRSPELLQQVEEALAGIERGDFEGGAGASVREGTAGCSSGCSSTSCGPLEGQVAPAGEDELDEETRFEVLLATLPEKLADRYRAAGREFRRAWLASQNDDPQYALELLDQVPEEERDALYYCERGNLKGRSGDFQAGIVDLDRAMAAEPDLFVALSSMVDLLAGCGRMDEAERLLRETLAGERFQGYCWANLAQLLARRGEDDDALELAERALATGRAGQGTLLLCAGLLEKKDRYAEAEALLAKLQGGGCAPGAHPMLAEFWLRRNKNLDKALESFKAALRREQDNPRWLLRIAQVYLARGWKNEAAEHLDRLLSHGGLTEELRREVQATADQLRRQ